jgi:adenylyltransferase/sulfurtransferase
MLIPLSELESRIDELNEHKNREVIVYCRSGNRSGKATNILREDGFQAFNMSGGMLAWNKMLNATEPDTIKVKNEATVE